MTLRMLISTSKLLKEPLNRTIDVFPYFIYISLYFIIIITIFLFLAVERNFSILEVDSFFFIIEMKCF